ncbi:F-box protein FBW2 [Dendrobium catenatum]|uniref:F-box protein FBW2 n=1 Tax=Dendrobium catenatum TaxID=906689 RepID=A0A2I0V9Q8_9ASPA|nr:F-box protein FBW2 [Dendrobium catenatum]
MSRRGINDDNWRDWERINHDILALIFKKIPSDEMARTISFVCKSWQEAVAGPCCWTEINIEECGINLNVLEIPMSEVNDSAIQKYSGSLTSLTTLDISYCDYITYKGIKILGNNCTSLISLKRNLTPAEFESTQNNEAATKVNEKEALAIANTMFGLEQLELSYGRFSDYGSGTSDFVPSVSHVSPTRTMDLPLLALVSHVTITSSINLASTVKAVDSVVVANSGERVRLQLDWLHCSSDSSSEDSGEEVPEVDLVRLKDRLVVSVSSRGRGRRGESKQEEKKRKKRRKKLLLDHHQSFAEPPPELRRTTIEALAFTKPPPEEKKEEQNEEDPPYPPPDFRRTTT